MAKTSAERSREWRERQKAKAAQPKRPRKATTPAADADARKATARERYAVLKRDPKRYEAMLAAARIRAKAFHARRKAAAKKKAGSR